MAEKHTSQTQQAPTMPWGMDASWGLEGWRKLTQDNMARWSEWMTEAATFEKAGLEQAGRAIEESAKLMQESMRYGAELTGEWRKMMSEATQRTLEMMTPKA